MNNILSEDYRQIFFRTKNIHKCFKDKKILMVGSNGFLGQYFIKFFEELSAKYNFQLDAIDNLITSKKISKKIKKIKFMKRDISKLKISLNIYAEIALKKYPFCIVPFIKQIYFLPNMNKYLLSVVKGFKYHIETGNDVKKNQFDNNPMFSL